MLLMFWAALSVALAAAVCANACTEWLANLMTGGVHDLHHESLLPAAIAAVVVTASLVIALLGLRIRREDGFARMHRSRGARLAFVLATALLTACVLVAMEGYETYFGGVAVFDPHSIVMSHLWLVALAYAVSAIAIDRMLRACLRIAARVVVLVLDAFRRRAVNDARAVGSYTPWAICRCASHIGSVCGFRAPPACRDIFARLSWRRVSCSFVYAP
ncbi:MAG TPA: hypothetical protein VIK27_05160 [Candidatus Aquilonibacter sp.]